MEEPMGIHPTSISVPADTILGHRQDGRPIYPIAGGAESDEPDVVIEDDPTPETVDDTEPEPTDDPEPEPAPKPTPPAKKEPEWKPPTEAEWKRTQAALKKANDDGKLHRLRNKELEEAARAGETEHERALREAREEGEKRFREPMKKAGVRAALAEAGFTNPERVMRLVDWEAVTVDDDGDLIGVDSEVDRVKGEYPELLPQDKPKPKARPTGAPKPAAQEKPKTTAELHAARILGRA
ncbi:phage scaffolding protein [Streptomyces sp. SID4982]|uniref:phage scaffolding protein n=1 Tax=Streptomyces sp. SID4982 TaxID=2690291 RepID=UPI00136FE018|nr:phage scaffolding protein [Streptomyces sp. SID4982]MYS15175.1 hypothetical protein [Streptomyces sp. SID4982]